MANKKLKASGQPSKVETVAGIPNPFEKAPAELEPLLETFDKSLVYIIHIDYHPADFKRRIFSVPIGLNIVIATILLWRAWFAIPLYWAILLSILGNPNETTIYFAKSSIGQLVMKVLRRFLVFVMDYLLVTIVAPWPWSFFLEEPGNPIKWRWRIGFRNEEIYVRQSRHWGTKDLLGEAEGSSGKAGSESPFWKTRIEPEVDVHKLRAKTGYLLMNENFDLDFAGMISATYLLDKKTITAKVLCPSVFIWVGTPTVGQWCVWVVDKADPAEEAERNKSIAIFKRRLIAMGKESLFDRWAAIVQEESSKPGGFTYDRQVAAAERVTKMFRDNGIDDESFKNEVLIPSGLPV